MKPQKPLVAVAVGVYLLGFGILVGMALDRMRFDGQRTAVLTHYEQALTEWKTYRDGVREGCRLNPPGTPDECESPMTSRAHAAV